MTDSQSLEQLAARFWAFQCEEFPINAIMAGVRVSAGALLREAPEDHERRARWALSAKDELRMIDATALGTEDRATHALLQREFDMLTENVECQAYLKPYLFPLGPEFMLVYWANATALATVPDVQLYLDRLSSIPATLDGVRASLAEGIRQGFSYPELTLKRAVENVRGQTVVPVEQTPFYQPLARIAGRSEAFAAFAERGQAIITQTVVPALDAYAAFIETELAEKARFSLSCTDDINGEAVYRYHIRYFATVDLPPDEIYTIGLAEVERLKQEMEAIAAEAGYPGDLAQFVRYLKKDNQQFMESAEALRERIEVISKRIDERIPEFFGRAPRMTYGVRSMPEAVAAKMPPAYAQPNPADGSAAGVHWVTSLPSKCPRYMHLPLALHEAWPGHLMHLALIQEMEHLPGFRRFGGLRYAACLEGWAVYCEALGHEMGFYDTPEKRYGQVEMEMWRAVRLVVDTGIHLMGWDREQAISYFQEHIAMPLETITAEVDRYISLPGQALAYQLGNLQFRKLRRQAEAVLGDAFRIRDFHDALMRAGPVTLPVLELLIDAWIAEQQEQLSVCA